MFGQRSKEAEPEGRYYAELINGPVDLEGLDRKNEASLYAARAISYQRGVQEALNRGGQQGWKLINVTSPASFQAIQEGNAFGAMAPTLLFWDIEG